MKMISEIEKKLEEVETKLNYSVMIADVKLRDVIIKGLEEEKEVLNNFLSHAQSEQKKIDEMIELIDNIALFDFRIDKCTDCNAPNGCDYEMNIKERCKSIIEKYKESL